MILGRGYSEHNVQAEQHRQEITDFIDAIVQMMPVGHRQQALEIGLFSGGTHLIWKMLFENVMSVDIDARAVMLFLSGLIEIDGSKLICANSQLKETKSLVEKELEIGRAHV